MTYNESSKNASLKYHKKALEYLQISLHKVNDKDVIEHLKSVTNKSGYIKALIRKDIQK